MTMHFINVVLKFEKTPESKGKIGTAFEGDCHEQSSRSRLSPFRPVFADG